MALSAVWCLVRFSLECAGFFLKPSLRFFDWWSGSDFFWFRVDSLSVARCRCFQAILGLHHHSLTWFHSLVRRLAVSAPVILKACLSAFDWTSFGTCDCLFDSSFTGGIITRSFFSMTLCRRRRALSIWLLVANLVCQSCQSLLVFARGWEYSSRRANPNCSGSTWLSSD